MRYLSEAKEDLDLDNQDGRWWRYSEYIIEEGRGWRNVIRPGPGATLERYDPWQDFRATERMRRTVNPPYRELLELARNLTFGPDEQSLTAESAGAIKGWCARYGLLGILPATTEVITLQPAWQARDAGSDLYPGYTRLIRRSGVWVRRLQFVEQRATPDEADDRLEIRLQEIASQNGWPRPGAHTWHWEEHDLKEEDLARAVHPFFPDVPLSQAERWQYPRPGSVPFWQGYGEPVRLFAKWAHRFLQAVEIVSRFDPRVAAKIDSVNDALSFLEDLAETVGRPRRFRLGERAGTKKLVHDVVAPSLLAAYAGMFLQDAEFDRRALRCQTCRKLFISDDIRAQYCSQRCRTTMQRRRQRQRAAEEE